MEFRGHGDTACDHALRGVWLLQGAAQYIAEHPAPADPASVRVVEASKPGAVTEASADWKWDLLRPVQLCDVQHLR